MYDRAGTVHPWHRENPVATTQLVQRRSSSVNTVTISRKRDERFVDVPWLVGACGYQERSMQGEPSS